MGSTRSENENENDVKYMREAMKQAVKAYEAGEVPIGCIIVENATGKVIGRG